MARETRRNAPDAPPAAGRAGRTRPSRAHAVVGRVVSRPRRGTTDPDPDAMLRAFTARHIRETAHGPRPLPTGVVPGFRRRFDLVVDDSAGFPTYVFAPAGRTPTRTVMHLHGGSYVSGLSPFHLLWTSRLANALDARIVLPDYPLAPVHTWRDSHSALVETAARWAAHASRVGERPVTLSGDSAGGGYALSIAQGLRDHGGPQPERLLLHAPWVDLTVSTPETYEVAKVDPWLDIDEGNVQAAWWAGGDDLARWELSPVFGDLTGLPRALQLYGTRDLLMPGCRLLQKRADAAGWNLTSIEEPDLLHVYSIFPPFVPEARRAFTQVLDFLA
ncbi:alpha/beta hydrolase [Nocardioides yefusunii]|uniref:Alpha/beta hydrolase n=1 Tax=Nocardioides yefusunii TaxID=2500546 RepID=A0ABW1R1H7_9ACTN|nr:alpha/beta hydrolase [Nocardioides yefusunii]